MGFVALKCPACGADIQLNDEKEYGFCSYCGTKIVQDKTVIEHTGKIAVDGIASEKSLLDRAFIYIEDGNFFSADEYLEKVLDMNPTCSKAYFGKLLCQKHSKTADDLILNLSEPLDNNSNYEKAVRFADSKELKEYESINNALKNNLSRRGELLQEKINATSSKITELRKQLITEEKDNIKLSTKKVMSKTILIVLCFLTAFSFLFFIVSFTQLFTPERGVGAFIFLLIFFVGSFTAMIKQNKKVNKEKLMEKSYTNTKSLLISYENELTKYQREYSNWISKHPNLK